MRATAKKRKPPNLDATAQKEKSPAEILKTKDVSAAKRSARATDASGKHVIRRLQARWFFTTANAAFPEETNITANIQKYAAKQTKKAKNSVFQRQK